MVDDSTWNDAQGATYPDTEELLSEDGVLDPDLLDEDEPDPILDEEWS